MTNYQLDLNSQTEIILFKESITLKLTQNKKCGDDEDNEGRLDDDPDKDAAGVVEGFRKVEQPCQKMKQYKTSIHGKHLFSVWTSNSQL